MEQGTDEHDLAKALDSVAAELSAKAAARTQTQDNATPQGSTLSFEEPAAPTAPPSLTPPTPVATPSEPFAAPTAPSPVSTFTPPVDDATPAPYLSSQDDSSSDSLESIKKDALVELRPLVDKLSVSPEEKFDTYLLLIRSTDDKDLIAPAHEAAKAIDDEARRAEALLDIIKEIDYLSNAKKN